MFKNQKSQYFLYMKKFNIKIFLEKKKTFYISHLMYGITSLEIEALQECFDITFLVHGFLAPPPVLENLKN